MKIIAIEPQEWQISLGFSKKEISMMTTWLESAERIFTKEERENAGVDLEEVSRFMTVFHRKLCEIRDQIDLE